MIKKLIYQVYVGNTNALYDFCIESVACYCKKYNIDHIVLKEPILKIVPVDSKRSAEAINRLGYLPIYEKENAFSYLESYDAVCIVDSDIFIMPSAPDIFDQLEEYEFAAVAERDMPITDKYRSKIKKYSHGQYSRLSDEADFKWNTNGAEFFNMGLMLLSNKLLPYIQGQTPEEFIKRKEFERFVNGEGDWRWSTDQTLLNYWVKKYNIHTKNLDWKWNALYRGIKDEYLSQAYFIHFFLSVHIPKNQTAESIIKQILSK
jgi:hypothetical protein